MTGCCGGGRPFDIVFCLGSCRRCLLPGDKQFQNVLLLSIAFMLIFTAFQTLSNIEQTVLQSIRNQDPSFTGDAYKSLAIIYIVFSISNWFVPPVVALIKAKWTMILGASLYCFFIASFLYPTTWLLYTTSALLGFGGAFLWTAQGNYLTLSSSPETMSRNSGLFWAILQCSMFFGNGFVFWMFEGKEEIDKTTQIYVFSTLSVVGIVGILVLACLRPHPGHESSSSSSSRPTVRFDVGNPTNINSTFEHEATNTSYTSTTSSNSNSSSLDSTLPPPPNPNPSASNSSDENAWIAIQKTFALTKNPDIILLTFLFVYTGLELSFQSGIFSTCVADTQEFGLEAKRLVGLCGIMVGAGEVTGGALFGLLGSRMIKNGRDPVILLGFISHTLAFYLTFLNLPNVSPLRQTFDFTYIGPSEGIVMLCAFLLGFGDACFSTQIYSIIGALFPNNSSPPFAWFKFTQSLAAAISFFTSTAATLTIQLTILQIVCTLGTITFFFVEWNITRDRIEEENQLMISNEEDTENYG